MLTLNILTVYADNSWYMLELSLKLKYGFAGGYCKKNYVDMKNTSNGV